MDKSATLAPPAVRPEPVPGVEGLRPYKQGRIGLPGVARPLKLSSNESHLGPSPRALAAYAEAGKTLFRYTDGSQADLRAAIGEVFGLEPARIICANGSEEMIQLIVRSYVRPGDEVVISEFSFAMAFVHAAAQGARLVKAPEAALRPDADAILACVTPRTRLVVLATPNNPVGQYLPSDELRRLHAALPRDVLLLVDAAYGDYVEAPDYSDGVEIARGAENVVVTHTFSKLYGLAGLRIGWGYLPAHVADVVERIRTPFNVNCAGLAAAEAAVRDQAYAAEVRRENNIELARISAAVQALGIGFVPSYANFYLLRFAEPKSPAGALAALEAVGIIPRPVNAGGPEDCLRITVGRPAENDAVLAALAAYMADGAA